MELTEVKAPRIPKCELEVLEYVPGQVSIVIPVYNKEKFVRDAIRSAWSQTYPDVEVVVIDDHSSDNSVAAIAEAMQEFFGGNLECWKKARVMSLPRRVGAAWAQNIGYYLTRGEFIANLDADDLCDPDRIAQQMRFIRENQLDACGCSYYPLEEDGSAGRPAGWLRCGRDVLREEYARGIHRLCWGTVVMHRRCLHTLGGNTLKMPGAEDFEAASRLVREFRVDNLMTPLYGYRQHPGQRSRAYFGS